MRSPAPETESFVDEFTWKFRKSPLYVAGFAPMKVPDAEPFWIMFAPRRMSELVADSREVEAICTFPAAVGEAVKMPRRLLAVSAKSVVAPTVSVDDTNTGPDEATEKRRGVEVELPL